MEFEWSEMMLVAFPILILIFVISIPHLNLMCSSKLISLALIFARRLTISNRIVRLLCSATLNQTDSSTSLSSS